MRHIFIVNPAAGHQDTTAELTDSICRAIGDRCYEIHRTEHPGHARELTDMLAAQYAPDICRFYACGGDGTLSEVASGAVGHENAEVACVPCGTGNDFAKIFAPRERLRDLTAQIEGTSMPFDVLEVNGRYCLNICNSGIDARVALWAHLNKRKLPFSGIFPYAVALVINYFKRINRYYTLEIDGNYQEGEYAIIVAANGRCYGGGFNAVPEAEPDDGLIDILYVPRVSRLTLLRCIGKFAVGRHADIPELIRWQRCQEVHLTTREPEALSIDGEISLETDVHIRILPKKLRFVQPVGASVTHHSQPVGV